MALAYFAITAVLVASVITAAIAVAADLIRRLVDEGWVPVVLPFLFINILARIDAEKIFQPIKHQTILSFLLGWFAVRP
ncbi:MAG: hypothetical protein EBX65_09685 [Betaproteobacteria bacterium]|nr:hypothetical protein [Betaproteobacteria bacterium]NCZ75740.1 hypothetical protein [Betaproteobacteria bacterium]